MSQLDKTTRISFYQGLYQPLDGLHNKMMLFDVQVVNKINNYLHVGIKTYRNFAVTVFDITSSFAKKKAGRL